MVQEFGLGVDINHNGRAVRLRWKMTVEPREDPSLGHLRLVPTPQDPEQREILGAMLALIESTFRQKGELPSTDQEGRHELPNRPSSEACANAQEPQVFILEMEEDDDRVGSDDSPGVSG